MTPEERQRKKDFDRLYRLLPGRNPDRITAVCKAVVCQPNTVRVWTMKKPPRVISARSLELLRRHVEGIR